MTPTALEERLVALRQDFDRSFARAVAEEQPTELDFLAIRVGGDPYALRLSDVRRLYADSRLVRAPSLLPELLGVCGFRSVLTPVYDLAPLLGYAAGSNARWLVVAENPAPIAFAFAEFEFHLRVSPEHVSSAEPSGAAVAVGGVVQNGGITRTLLRLPALIAGLAQRIKAFGPSQER